MGGNLSLFVYSLQRTSGQSIEADKENDKNIVHEKSTNEKILNLTLREMQ